MEIINIRLRYIKSKDMDEIERVVNNLPFRIEIKSFIKDGKNWVLWFILPENPLINMQSVDL